MNMKKLLKFFAFICSSSSLLAISPLLQDSIAKYEEKFEEFLDINGSKIEVESIDSLLKDLPSLLDSLRKEEECEKSRKDLMKIEGALLRYESDVWFFEELKTVLPDFTDRKKLKYLYDIACNSPRYHYVMVKLIADYSEVKAMVKVFSGERATKRARFAD